MTHPLPCFLIAFTLLLSACGGSGGGGDRVGRLDPPPATDNSLRPARPGAPYADVLVGCARPYDREGDNTFNECTLEQLPLLGQSGAALTVNDVLERTLVSHDWMALRFEQTLRQLPDDLLQLFGGVTAVVIGSDIRPSYYWLSTGAIYLDPASLWLTIEERNTISREPDYRSDFNAELSFDSLARFVRNGNYAWSNPSLSGPGSDRPLSSILAPMASLLFHELAHANDYIPPSAQTNLNPDWRLPEAATQLQDENVSAHLHSTYRLNSELMMDLAEVAYQGRPASESEKALTAQEVGLEFASDAASDDYAYVTSASRQLFFEDTAMMFEEVMMQYHFGITREVAFTDRPEQDSVYCEDYIVRWGERGRVGNPAVRPRAALVTALLLDRTNIQPYIDALPPSQAMATGIHWCASLNASATGRHGEHGSQWQTPLPENDRQRHWNQPNQGLLP